MSTNTRRLLSICNSVLLFAAIFVDSASAFSLPQTTLVQGSPNRNQGQNQQGLPPEKKKSLSNYGPEDAFPGETDQEQRKGKRGRSAARPSPTAAPSATPRPEASPSIAPSMTPVKAVADATRPTPSGTAAVVGLTQQGTPQPLTSNKEASTDLVLPGLAIVSLFVLTALIYVIFKLMEKLREGSN